VLDTLPTREDRAFVTDLSYGVVRWEIALTAALAARLSAPERLPTRVRDALLAGAYERTVRGTPEHAAVHAWVELIKRGPARERPLAGLANAVLRRVDLADARGDAAVSLPPWLAQEFRGLLGDETALVAARGMLAPEPLWLTALDEPAARSALAADGADVVAGPVPGSLAVRAPVPLPRLTAFTTGSVQPQNPASLAVVDACGDVSGRRVLDLCGGRAIKAASLAARGAHVTTVDVDVRASEAGRRNLARLGRSAVHVVADLTDPRSVAAAGPDVAPAPVVLLDAPCSGTGTLRGHPEIKARVDEAAVTSLAALQARLLDTAATLTAPGGRLVYAVCALTRAEGPAQAAAFLARHPDFEAREPTLPLPTQLAGVGRIVVPVDGLDGFYVAAFERTP
jgi:16S rRNA (cytosine967-C5)-methyltransferase